MSIILICHLCRKCSTTSTLYIPSDSVKLARKPSYVLCILWQSNMSTDNSSLTDDFPIKNCLVFLWYFRHAMFENPPEPSSQVRLLGRDRALKVPAACRHGVTETWAPGWRGLANHRTVHGEHSEDPEILKWLEYIGIDYIYIYTIDNIWVMIWDNSLIDITECVVFIPWPDQTHGYLRTWARHPTCPPLNQPREVPKSLFGKSTILSPTTSTCLKT